MGLFLVEHPNASAGKAEDALTHTQHFRQAAAAEADEKPLSAGLNNW